jgi:hypothetical protein
VAEVLTLVQTKQMRINIHKRNNTKTQYKQYKTEQIQVYILPKHPHITKQVQTTTVQVKTTTVQDTHQIK